MQYFKLVVVGDGTVGKTSLLITSQTGSFPPEYIPSVFENDVSYILVESRVYSVALWDTGGGEDYHRLRPLSYPDTDAFLVCFDVSNRNSFENIEHYWIPETRRYCPDSANILVGNKIDLRSNSANNDRSPQDFITYEEGRQLASRLGISTYLECSSLTHEGLDVVIPTAVRTAVRENPCDKTFVSLNGEKISYEKSNSASTSLSMNIKILPTAGQAPRIEITTSTFADEWREVLTGQDTSCTDVKFIIAPDNCVLHAHKIVLASSSVIFKDIFLSPEKSNQVPNRYSQLFEEIKWIHNKPSNSDLNDETNESDCAEIILNQSINYDVFIRILEFLYTGLPGFSESEDARFVQEIKDRAELFRLDSLKQVCENIQSDEAFLNLSISRQINDDVGSNMKRLFLNKPQMSDVKFRVEGKLVYAHKAVLTARCDVMAAMLGGAFMEGRSSTETEIKDANLESFLAILEYLYTDHAPIEEGDAIDIMVLADRFCLPRLVTLCELYFTKKVDKMFKKKASDGIDYVVNLLLLSQAHNAQQLSNWCLHFIATNYLIFESSPFLSLVQGTNKEYVEEHRWPPLSYINDLQEYLKEIGNTSKDTSNCKCSVM